MNVYFLRHGLADWPDWNASDDKRPLTPDGIEKMKAEAKAIARLVKRLDVIVSSPLVRARQTAEIVGDALGLKVKVSPLVAPGFDSARLAELLKAHAKATALMVVGHEPDFSATISALVGGGRIVMKKGGLARVDIEAGGAPGGELVWLLAPKTLIKSD